MINLNKKIFLIFIFTLSFFLTGCFLDPYTNSKFGEEVVYTWFSYKEDDIDLGSVRRSVENIHEIKDVSCKFDVKYKSNYIFYCNIEYIKNSNTIIPFADTEELNVYAVFTPDSSDTYTYKVYNSKSEEGIWKQDESLK